MNIPADFQASPDLLKDRVILITGAGDGIGKAVALACAKHGASVILLGKTLRKLENIYDDIEEAGYPQPGIFPMNLETASPTDYEQLALTISENYGRLDGIVHNAADLPYLSRLKDYDAEDWLKVMQTNLNAPFLITQACIDLLADAEDASVLFTTDTVGSEAKAYWGAYSASKFGIESLAMTWAEELKSTNIRSNLINPGVTLTALRKRIYPGEDNKTIKTADTVTPMYLWMLSDQSKEVRGQKIAFS